MHFWIYFCRVRSHPYGENKTSGDSFTHFRPSFIEKKKNIEQIVKFASGRKLFLMTDAVYSFLRQSVSNCPFFENN